MKLLSGILAVAAVALVAGTAASLAAAHSPADQAIGAMIAAWTLLGASYVFLTLGNEIPGWASVAALVLHPASGAAAIMVAQESSRHPGNAGMMLLVPVLGALGMAAYVLYSVSGRLQAVWSPKAAGVATAGIVAVISIAPWTM